MIMKVIKFVFYKDASDLIKIVCDMVHRATKMERLYLFPWLRAV